jgi:hypothetical protein
VLLKVEAIASQRHGDKRDVRFGSKADILRFLNHVRFLPEIGHNRNKWNFFQHRGLFLTSRDVIEASIAKIGFQLWRMKK